MTQQSTIISPTIDFADRVILDPIVCDECSRTMTPTVRIDSYACASCLRAALCALQPELFIEFAQLRELAKAAVEWHTSAKVWRECSVENHDACLSYMHKMRIHMEDSIRAYAARQAALGGTAHV